MVYLVEDDANIRQLVIYTLLKSDLSARGFSSAEEFFAALEEGELPELIMLDIMLPNTSGLEILSQLRENEKTRELPVMMLSAKGSEYDKVVALDMGADDYVTKPFGMMELLARVRALLRRTPKQQGIEEYKIGALYVCPERHIVTVSGQEISLTLKEFELLTVLLKNRGLVISRDALLDRVWGYGDFGGGRTVDVHISTLRQKLGEAGALIETIRGVGYKIGGSGR